MSKSYLVITKRKNGGVSQSTFTNPEEALLHFGDEYENWLYDDDVENVIYKDYNNYVEAKQRYNFAIITTYATGRITVNFTEDDSSNDWINNIQDTNEACKKSGILSAYVVGCKVIDLRLHSVSSSASWVA